MSTGEVVIDVCRSPVPRVVDGEHVLLPEADCPRHGVCCECMRFHRAREGEPVVKRLPHCVRFLLSGVGG